MDLPFQNKEPSAPGLPASLALPPEAASILRPDGTLTPGSQPPLSEQETLSALGVMMLSRLI